tara:strand:- start:3295 stop:3609 length:315 start_codon:yes stop_codon:yes gene_type:complete
MNSIEWLQSQKPEPQSMNLHGQVFYMRQPTVSDRDRFDSVISNEGALTRLRTLILQAVLCDEDGNLIAKDASFDGVRADILEPLVDKAREMFGLTDSPIEGETD